MIYIIIGVLWMILGLSSIHKFNFKWWQYIIVTPPLIILIIVIAIARFCVIVADKIESKWLK